MREDDLTELEHRKSGRVLVFVVAYQHEKFIEALFERIPKEMFNNDHVHFLVIDDAGGDTTAEVLQKWVDDRDIGFPSVQETKAVHVRATLDNNAEKRPLLSLFDEERQK